jgi:hypothetical protein
MNADKTTKEDGKYVYFKLFSLVLSAFISANQRLIFLLLRNGRHAAPP